VVLDTGRDETSGESEVRLRWKDLRKELEAAGAPEVDLGAVQRVVLDSSPARAGDCGRVVVAAKGDVLLDVELPARPVRDEAVHGPVPHLMPVVRAFADAVSYLLVQVDRAGADIHVVTPGERSEHTVDGEHEVLHKVPGGGWAQWRYQRRVEDSWQHNAAAVARDLDQLVDRHGPEVVVVVGDDKAVALLREQVSDRVAGRLVVARSGGRADGISARAQDEAVQQVLQDRVNARRGRVVDRFRQELGRQKAAVETLEDVVAVLRRGQVEELLLRDDPTSTDVLWVGSDPLQVATSRSDVLALGADEAWKVRADAAILRALLAQDAGIALVDDDQSPRGGIGALLRYSDGSTPREALPSMPGHGDHLGTHHRGL
jgi:hypothetical protein